MMRRVSLEVKIFRLALILALFLTLAGPIAIAGQKTQGEASPILIPVKGLVNMNRTMSLPGQGRVEMIGFSPDGRLLALAGGNRVLLWDFSAGSTKELTVPTRSPVFFSAFDFSPDGLALATVSGREKVALWDLNNEASRTLDSASSGSSVSFSPDGKYLALNASSGGIEIWDVSTGKKVNTFAKKKGKAFGRVLFSPDGKYIAAVDEGKNIALVEANSGKLFRSFYGHQGFINDFAISRDGKILVSGGSDKRIIIWGLPGGEKLKDINPLPAGVNDLDISSDGRLIVAALGPGLVPWETAKPETSVMILDLKTNEGQGLRVPFCYSVALSPDGKSLATGSSGGEELAALWEIRSPEIAEKFKKDPFETTAEYEARVNQIEIPYSEAVVLNPAQYNADLGGFEIQFKKNRLFIQVERETARKLLERKAGQLQLRGRLRSHDPENLKLQEPVLEDTVTGDKFPVVKTGEVKEETK